MSMTQKPLEKCSLPELAELLVKDPNRQTFPKIWEDENQGLVNDKVQVIRARIDQGVYLDEIDEQERTALDILLDPSSNISTDPGTVLALLEAGARTNEHVMSYVEYPVHLYRSGVHPC